MAVLRISSMILEHTAYAFSGVSLGARVTAVIYTWLVVTVLLSWWPLGIALLCLGWAFLGSLLHVLSEKTRMLDKDVPSE
jgi:hypothetical protein